MSVDDELKKVKNVSSEAGSVSFVSVSEAIKLDKYKEQKASKKGVKRCSFLVSKHKDL